ncbi:MAG: polysaccharide deacetylase family protein [Candidatus Latescibacterota bacterium]|nr:MAG: polysaccharide deacetylase family protein [Candidatus Latescibacterota bacterium]
MSTPVPILMYHRISSSKCPVPAAHPEEAPYAVDLEEFRWQIDHMFSSGYRGMALGQVLDDLVSGGRVGGKEVVLTFDDGNRSDYEHVLPVLAERGFRATFFITGDRIGKPDGLEKSMIHHLSESGMEIGSHGMTHRFLSLLDEAEQEAECKDSMELLRRITGTDVRFFSLPGGRQAHATIPLLKSLSYEAVCTSKLGYNPPGVNPFALKRIPITRSTNRRKFRGILRRTRYILLPLYVRAMTLEGFRAVLGEKGYRGVRSLLAGK